MSATTRVFVNEAPAEVPAGSTVRDAVRTAVPDLASGLADGSTHVTDGVGRRVALDEPVATGAILRVVRSARRGERAG